MESTTLYFREGSSDKVYRASIEEKDRGYIVTFAYGRRGTTLQAGTKTPVAVQYDAARAIYEKLIREKQAKGYVTGEQSIAYGEVPSGNEPSGIQCQLLNPIEESEVETYLEDPRWWMQEKFDGRRLLIRKQNGTVAGINRRGLIVALPQTLMEDAERCPLDFILDGEAVGDMLCVFDVLLIGEEELAKLKYTERYVRLMNLLASFQHLHLHVVETHFTTEQKREAFERLKADRREGVVFKHIDAPYVAGRPASGDSQLKFKFCETASFVVSKINARRSVSLELHDGVQWVTAGNVTIPPNHDIPAQGSVVECRYLYAYRESGCIYQPVYRGVRDDIPSEECVTDQLKYKAEP